MRVLVKPPRENPLGATRDERSSGAEFLSISVSDTGKGIPEAELPTLFDEYSR